MNSELYRSLDLRITLCRTCLDIANAMVHSQHLSRVRRDRRQRCIARQPIIVGLLGLKQKMPRVCDRVVALKPGMGFRRVKHFHE